MGIENERQLLPIGTVVAGRYRVDQTLSSGGFGNTYVVFDLRFEERWAMKEFFMKGVSERDGNTTSVSVSAASKPQFEAQRAKFNKEAKRLRKLRHPGIVHVEDLCDDNGTSYYVMDYIGGGSLSELVKRHGPLSEERVRQLLPDLLGALEHVHAQQMWHLDIKPGNIMLNDNNRPVLIDFGASKQLGGAGGAYSTSVGMTYTEGYAPTEQIEQNIDRIGPWTDLYAVGATLYNLLTGKKPPLLSDIQVAGLEAFDFPKNISEQMRTLILWLMRMNPNGRFRPKSVAEVREFLSLDSTETAGGSNNNDDDGTRLPEKEVVKKAITDDDNSNSKWKIVAGVAVVAIVAVSAVVLWPKSDSASESPVAPQDEETLAADSDSINKGKEKIVEALTATNKKFTSSVVGNYTYTGPIDSEGKPHGNGEATCEDGKYYKGPFVHGAMEGTGAYFRMKNGDVFEGEFSADRFYKGRYTVKANGSYYEGTFTNGQPDQDNWYDKNGNRL